MSNTDCEHDVKSRVKGNFKTAVTRGVGLRKQKSTGTLTTLAEAIILQSIEDLWCEKEKADSMDFFTGERFRICSGMACLEFEDQLEVLGLVGNITARY